MKKVIFKDKPEASIYGQYNFPDDETTYTHTDSNSVPIRYDKFSDKDLYTTTVDNNLNKDIINGELQYNKNSYISIDKLMIKNAGVNHDVTRINTHVYIFDNLSTPGTIETAVTIDENSTYSEVLDYIQDSDANIYSRTGQHKDEGTHLDNIINGATILSGLYNDSGPVYDGNWSYAPDWPENSDTVYNTDKTYFWDMFTGESAETGIFNFSENQIIYVIVFTSGDEDIKYWPDTDRRNRIHVFRINTETDLIDPEVGGGVSQLPFEYGDALIFEGGGDAAPAWKVTDLQLTINTIYSTSDDEYTTPEQYQSIIASVTPPVKVELGENFNSQILRINPSAQISSEETLYNYTPVSKTNILGSQYDLQNYYTSDEERQVASAPTQVSLDFEISTDSVSNETELTSTSPTLGHMFYVISWDDMDNKFKTWDDVIDDIPEDEVKLLEKQQDNLYIFNDIGTPLINNYQTPGIKTIKSVMFSYDTTDNQIEPVRWKFITTRIFLDIPLNQYPDFGEVGGADYTTIPWPHTTPIIGGTDENSKYKKSIRDTLSGGKIGNQDIIDQTFLINDNENDELGQSIRKFDLEQVRYFNSSYDMASLLGIDIVEEGDNTNYLGNCDYGFWFNQLDGGTTEDEAYAYALANWETISTMGCTATVSTNQWRYTVCCPNGAEGGGRNCVDDPGGDVNLVLVSNPVTGEQFFDTYTAACGIFDTGFKPHTDSQYWDGEINSFSEETSVGEIFISDNSDSTLKEDCKLELNCGNLTGKSIVDSSGNSNKGLLIGDYKIKKTRKNRPMRRDSFIKIPKKNDNSNGAL